MTWSCFAAIIDVLSKIFTTIFAGFGALIAYQTLVRTPVQEPEPKSPSIGETELTTPTEIIVFKTSNQTTKLKATKKGLECYLQDSRPKKQSGRQWTLTTEQAQKILTSRNYRIYPGYKLYSGVFSIGARKNWLYSKKLFPEPSLLELELEKILEKTIALS